MNSGGFLFQAGGEGFGGGTGSSRLDSVFLCARLHRDRFGGSAANCRVACLEPSARTRRLAPLSPLLSSVQTPLP